jgi:hypothetical protein
LVMRGLLMLVPSEKEMAEGVSACGDIAGIVA